MKCNEKFLILSKAADSRELRGGTAIVLGASPNIIRIYAFTNRQYRRTVSGTSRKNQRTIALFTHQGGKNDSGVTRQSEKRRQPATCFHRRVFPAAQIQNRQAKQHLHFASQTIALYNRNGCESPPTSSLFRLVRSAAADTCAFQLMRAM